MLEELSEIPEAELLGAMVGTSSTRMAMMLWMRGAPMARTMPDPIAPVPVRKNQKKQLPESARMSECGMLVEILTRCAV